MSSAKHLVPVDDLDSLVAELGGWSLAPGLEGFVLAAAALGRLLAEAVDLAETNPRALSSAIAGFEPASHELCAQVGRASLEAWTSPGDLELAHAALSSFTVRRDWLLSAVIQCTPALIWDLTRVLDPVHRALRHSPTMRRLLKARP